MPRQSADKASRDLGGRLREWRSARRQSQLELALNAGISQRHYSFLESGRSSPSREVLVRIADALAVPYRERNALLLAAGYAPLYADDGWNGPGLQHVMAALQRMLAQQEPYPALVLDRHWNVVLTNQASPRFFGHFIDLGTRPKPRNLLHLLFDPAALRPFLVDWEDLARSLIRRVYREAVGGVLDAASQALLDTLLAYPGTRDEWRLPSGALAPDDLPVVPVRLSHEGVTLSYFSLLTTLATPQTIHAQELRIECMFPYDAATEQHHAQLMHQALPGS